MFAGHHLAGIRRTSFVDVGRLALMQLAVGTLVGRDTLRFFDVSPIGAVGFMNQHHGLRVFFHRRGWTAHSLACQSSLSCERQRST